MLPDHSENEASPATAGLLRGPVGTGADRRSGRGRTALLVGERQLRQAGTVGDVEVKKKLAAALNTYIDPMRTRRNELIARPDTLRDILHEGSRKAREIAQQTMERVREAVKLQYPRSVKT